jgi:HlyD family secretion protein
VKNPSRILCLIALMLAVTSVAGCQERMPAPVPTTPTDPAGESNIAPGGGVTALGTILPAQRLKLGFLTAGPVSRVEVQIGSEVEAGDLVAALDTTALELTVQEAEDALAVSQALHVQAQAGPLEEAVAVAEAEYQRVLDQYEHAQSRDRQAQALSERALTQIHPKEVAIAQAEYDVALAHYRQVEAGAGPEALAVARVQLQKMEIGLQRAQAAYDRVSGLPDVGASPEAAALQEATIDYQAAESEYERLKNLPSRADLQEAKALLDQAEARLRLAQVKPQEVGEEEIASGADVAQAQLDLARTGPRPEDVAVVAAQVQQAHTALERAQQALSQAQLVAPFDGTISAVYLHPGEWAAAGAPVVELLNTTRWRVETRNIGELNIGRVKVGQEAIVRVMAFRGEMLHGRVVAISPIAVVQQGDTTYTVMIELETTDLNLRPGMNAEVEIVTE